jgi:hypothetical protein
MQSTIGGYEVQDLIGDGGMGAVYRGRDPRFDRLVAIKVLHPQFQRDPGVVDRFKAEAVIQAKLSHPHIVTVFDFVAGPDTLAIVMEYVDGLPLDTLVERAAGPLPLPRTLHLMDQVLSAMGYAHKRGLVHRDIKPSNILVQSIESQEYAKVMDFGIAKILGSEKLRTATGAKMGTLAYMSPEHVRSPKHVDARSDVYSLGVVLYEMLVGQVPFDADSEYELMRQIVEDQPRELHSFGSSLPEGLAAVLESALAKDPDRRFASCEQMRQALAATTPGNPSFLSTPAAPSVDIPPSGAATPVPAQTQPIWPRPTEAKLVPAASATPARPGWLLPSLLVLAAVVVTGAVAVIMRQRTAEAEVRVKAETEARLQRERDQAQLERLRLEAENARALATEREKARTVVARFEAIEVVKAIREGKEGTREFHLEFPEVRGLASPSVAQQVNSALSSLATTDGQSEQYTTGFDVRLLTRDVLSITTSTMTYTEGAMHPNHEMSGLTFDLNTGGRLGLDAVLGQPPATILDLVKDAAVRASEQCDIDTSGLKDIAPEKFYLKDGALVVFFNPYEVAAYACGFIEIPLTTEDLAPRLSAQSPLFRLVARSGAGADLSEDDAKAFVDRYMTAVNTSDVDRVAGLYADGADYYSWGPTPRVKIRDDKRLFYQRWPEHRYQRDGDLMIAHPAPGGIEVTFPMRFEVRGAGRSSAGRVEKTLGLERQGGEMVIVREREAVLDRATETVPSR